MKTFRIIGNWGTSIQVISEKLLNVGDFFDFTNLINIAPKNVDTTRFFYACIDFCQRNGCTKFFQITGVEEDINETRLQVIPVKNSAVAIAELI